jgi:hypothetical protein
MDTTSLANAKYINGVEILHIKNQENMALVSTNNGVIALGNFVDTATRDASNIIASSIIAGTYRNILLYSNILVTDISMRPLVIAIYTPSIIKKLSYKRIPRYSKIPDNCTKYTYSSGVNIDKDNIICKLYDIKDRNMADNEELSPWVFIWTSAVNKDSIKAIQKYVELSKAPAQQVHMYSNGNLTINVMICQLSAAANMDGLALVY